MNRISSVRSIATASSHKSAHGSELSSFEKILPQAPENIEMTIPRGMRLALSSSARWAGHLKAVKVVQGFGATPTCQALTYNVTVRPNGRKINMKELLKKPVIESDDLLALPQVRFNDAVLDAIIDERHSRSVFRQERLRKFNTHRFVPALVTERLVPCWRTSGSQGFSPAMEAAQKIKDACAATSLDLQDKPKKGRRKRQKETAFVMPTMAMAMKRRTKVEVVPPCWRNIGVLDLQRHPPIAELDAGGGGLPILEQLEKDKIADSMEARKLWLSHDVLPAGVSKPKWSEEVQEIREQSKVNLRSLHSKYAKKRSGHQRHAADNSDSTFEKYMHDCKVKSKLAAEEAAKAASAKKSEPSKMLDFGGLGFSLGKNKATTDSPAGEVPTLPA